MTLHPPAVFLRIALAFGVILALLTPPFQSPDEHLHFYRALQIADGHLICQPTDGRLLWLQSLF